MTMKSIQTAKMTSTEIMAATAVVEYLKRSLRGKNLAFALTVWEGGIENANDTVFIDAKSDPHGCPREEWLCVFHVSMEVLLSSRHVREQYPRVIEVFAAIKVAP